MTAKERPNVLFCRPNRSHCILLASVMRAGRRWAVKALAGMQMALVLQSRQAGRPTDMRRCAIVCCTPCTGL
jgi:hypothetical protein